MRQIFSLFLLLSIVSLYSNTLRLKEADKISRKPAQSKEQTLKKIPQTDQLFESNNIQEVKMENNIIQTYPIENNESQYWVFNSFSNSWENSHLVQKIYISIDKSIDKAYDLVVTCPNYIDGIYIKPVINRSQDISHQNSRQTINTHSQVISFNQGLQGHDWSGGEINRVFDKASIDLNPYILISGMYKVELELMISYFVTFDMKALSQRTYNIQYELVENQNETNRINRSHIMRRKK